jgi:lipopolysaccharide export system protein LptA
MRGKTIRSAAYGLSFLLFLVSLPPVASGAKTESPPSDTGPSFGGFSLTSRKEPIEITSGKLEFDYKARRVIFTDNVEVIQGAVHLQSDVLTVDYSQEGDKQQLQTATAHGHVMITQGAKKATGKHAVFDQKTRTIVLTGDAVLEEGSNQVSGDKIVVYPDDSRMEVLGQNHRVKVVLFPGQGPLAEGTTAGNAPPSTPPSKATPARRVSPKTEPNGSAQGP